MITRVVKMTFKPEHCEAFLKIFYRTQRLIVTQFPGCERLDLLSDSVNTNQYFTISYWRTLEDLESYRASDYFKNTWPQVKALFAEKAEAWSLTQH